MPKRKQNPSAPSPHPCAVEGCGLSGDYRAPKSRHALNDYQYFCLEHIRLFNKNWNYFTGMEQEEIEAFMKESITGHRPTWTREQMLEGAVEAALQGFMFWNTPKPPQAEGRVINSQDREAMNLLEISPPYSTEELKKAYRERVKLTHPDRHSGDKNKEEHFKRIVQAYQRLKNAKV